MVHEKSHAGMDGAVMFFVLLAVSAGDALFLWRQADTQDPLRLGMGLAIGAVLVLCWKGFMMVNPNEAQVLQLFGGYAGTVKASGLRWANPLCTRKKVSLRAVSFESSHLKVNDFDGNPIEIAAITGDAAKATS